MSERNEVVVTYADLSESSDNEAISGLLDEHAIGKADVIQDEICWLVENSQDKAKRARSPTA